MNPNPDVNKPNIPRITAKPPLKPGCIPMPDASLYFITNIEPAKMNKSQIDSIAYE